MSNEQPESCWTAVGNIIRERLYGPDGTEIRYGTKHFAPGAKVYIIDWYPGMCQSIVVVGQHRKSKRFITLSLDVRLVENFRAKVCYNPTAIAKFKKHYSPKTHYNASPIDALTKELAETMCQVLPYWQLHYSETMSRILPYWQLNYKTKLKESEPIKQEAPSHTSSFLSRFREFFRLFSKS